MIGFRVSFAFPATAAALAATVTAASAQPWLPLTCKAEKTVGLHDHIEETGAQVESYDPSVFVPSTFRLRENTTFSELLDAEHVDLYVTLRDDAADLESEFECNRVRGANKAKGFSCRNTPPSEILMIDPDTLRFTRSAVGGWTFFSATDTVNGASLFVEFGSCEHG